MNYDDLPPSVRAKIDAQYPELAKGRGPKGKARVRVQAAAGEGGPIVCTLCRRRFEHPTEYLLTKHTAEHGEGVRYELEITEVVTPRR